MNQQQPRPGCYPDSVGAAQVEGIEAVGQAYLKLADLRQSIAPKAPAAAPTTIVQSQSEDGLNSNHPGAGDGATVGGQLRVFSAKNQTHFWTVFRPVDYERGTVATAEHGAYVATVGAISAPFKGVAVMATVSGTGLVYGANTMRVGFCEGAHYVALGAQRLVKGDTVQTTETANSSPIEMMAHGLSRPYVGIAMGTYLFVAATASGVGTGLAGGLGGCGINFKEGCAELVDSMHRRSNGEQASALRIEGCPQQTENVVEAIPVQAFEDAKMVEAV